MAKKSKKPSDTRPKPNRSHGWYIATFIAGTLLPPLAVLMRFGVSRDFFINILFTICGYFPGHGHNYLQNIRDNTGRGRTPQWALKRGLIEPDKVQTHQWQHKYSERNHANHYDDDDAASIRSGRELSEVSSRTGGGAGKKVAGGGIEAARRNRYHGSSVSKSSDSTLEAREYDDDAESLGRHDFTVGNGHSSSGSASVNDSADQKKKSGGLKGFFSSSSSSSGGVKKDRFTKEREARESAMGGGRGGANGDEDEYGDEFEREINGGGNRRPRMESSESGDGRPPLPVKNPSRMTANEDDGLNHTF